MHAAAAACVFVAGFVPGFGALLVLAGVIRLGVAPFHATLLRTCEILPTGAMLLVGVAFLTTGLRAVHDGLFAIEPGTFRDSIAAAAAVAAVWSGLVALPQDDLRRRIGGYLAAQGAVWCGLLALLPAAEGRAAVGGWALVVDRRAGRAGRRLRAAVGVHAHRRPARLRRPRAHRAHALDAARIHAGRDRGRAAAVVAGPTAGGAREVHAGAAGGRAWAW